MKWHSFRQAIGDHPIFDLPTVLQMAGEPRPRVASQLSRWIRAGKLIHLRRGLYAMGDEYRRRPLSPLQVGNEVYRPSYLSCQWALSFYGILPDAVPVYQSVTTRITRRFANGVGSFTYANLKQELFWGSVTRRVDDVDCAIAEPEKALLDLWHLNSGEWTNERLLAMRFQQVELIVPSVLCGYAQRWQSPRIRRATSRWLDLLQDDAFGEAA